MESKITRSIKKLIRKFCKKTGLTEKTVTKVFSRGDVHQKKLDLIAMRAAIYAKDHVKPGTPYEEQQKIMDEFTKTEDLRNVHFPKITITNEKSTVTTADTKSALSRRDSKGQECLLSIKENEKDITGEGK